MCGVKDTARYSFLISIPIIIASFIMEIVEGSVGAIDINVVWLIVGMVVCMLIGLLCIKVMTKLVAQNKLTYFAYYLIVLSVILIIVGV
jgi:undecaprenyl-diphosphatase